MADAIKARILAEAAARVQAKRSPANQSRHQVPPPNFVKGDL